MNRPSSIYSPTDSSATRSSICMGSLFSDEGNACGFTDSKAQRECFAEYYDFSTANTTIRDEETGFGYFGARYYDSELLTGWLSVDPMSDKYPSLSPYAYCAWNPVKLVDPDGRDIWKINNEGKVVDYIKDKSNDVFYRVNDKGEYIEGENSSVKFKYGTIESHIKREYSYKNQKGIYDAFQVRGDENGEKLFEFLANAVADQGIEVSQIKCGVEGDQGLNFVSTAHFKPVTEAREDGTVHTVASEPSQAYLWNGRLQYGYTVREINHSHPLSSNPSKSDLKMAEQLQSIYSARNKPKPVLNIYYVKEGRYITY